MQNDALPTIPMSATVEIPYEDIHCSSLYLSAMCSVMLETISRRPRDAKIAKQAKRRIIPVKKWICCPRGSLFERNGSVERSTVMEHLSGFTRRIVPSDRTYTLILLWSLQTISFERNLDEECCSDGYQRRFTIDCWKFNPRTASIRPKTVED